MPNGGDTGERQLLTITLAVAGAAVIFLGVFVYFGESKLGGLKNESKRLKKEYDAQQGNIGDMRIEVEINKQLSNRIEQYAKFIVKEEEITDVLNQITRRALQVGLNLVNWRREDKKELNPVEAETYEKVIFEFQLTGSFHQIIKFLDDIEAVEEMGRLVVVQPSSIVAAKGGLVPGVESIEGHKFSFSISLYKYREQ